MACVYFLSAKSSPEVIRYVGRSRHDSPGERYTSHLYHATHGSNLHVHNWMRKTLANDEVVLTCAESGISYEESGVKEMHYIKVFRSRGYDLTNLTDGGEGTVGHKLTDQQKARVSEVHFGAKRSEETRKKISQSNKGKSRGKGVPKSEEHRRKMTEGRKGKLLGVPLSEEHKAKLRIPWNEERRERAPKKWSELRRQRFIERSKNK
jgi:hypothetical protein